jgi:hypothetical protein
VLELFNRHQRTDKGLGGLAAGPDAARQAIAAFSGEGYHVRSAQSDWHAGADEREFQREIIKGWAAAAAEIAPETAGMVHAWLRRRLEQVEAGRSRLLVGHTDVVALL